MLYGNCLSIVRQSVTSQLRVGGVVVIFRPFLLFTVRPSLN